VSRGVCNSARDCRNCLCNSRETVEQELATLDFLETQIASAEKRLEAIMKVSVDADLLKTLPCVGKILSMVLMLEIGRVDRFPTAAHLASYPTAEGWSFANPKTGGPFHQDQIQKTYIKPAPNQSESPISDGALFAIVLDRG
jgi:hypothetical protein